MEIDRVGRIVGRIKEIRQSKNLSITELAKKAGIKRPNLSRLESGKHLPSLDTIEKLAEALEVSIADIVAIKQGRK